MEGIEGRRREEVWTTDKEARGRAGVKTEPHGYCD